MPTITRKKLLKTATTVDIGCSSCRPPNLFHIFRNKPKFTTPKQTHYSSSSSSFTSTSSSNQKGYAFSVTPVKSFFRESVVAVEKDSGDPYLDFRHSMLQMILENEIYSKDDLRELLNCFVQLNAPCNHGVIIRAFTDVWNGVFSVRSSNAAMQLRLARKSAGTY